MDVMLPYIILHATFWDVGMLEKMAQMDLMVRMPWEVLEANQVVIGMEMLGS